MTMPPVEEVLVVVGLELGIAVEEPLDAVRIVAVEELDVASCVVVVEVSVEPEASEASEASGEIVEAESNLV